MPRLILALPLVALLTACTNLSQEEETAIRDSLVEVAIAAIAEAKDAGLDPLQMSESQLRLVHLACGTADRFLPVLESYLEARNADNPDFEPIDFRGYVASACAIADAVISIEPAPVPAPKPEA